MQRVAARNAVNVIIYFARDRLTFKAADVADIITVFIGVVSPNRLVAFYPKVAFRAVNTGGVAVFGAGCRNAVAVLIARLVMSAGNFKIKAIFTCVSFRRRAGEAFDNKVGELSNLKIAKRVVAYALYAAWHGHALELRAGSKRFIPDFGNAR